MKLLRNLTIAGVAVAKASPQACRDKMTASWEEYPIENGSWDNCRLEGRKTRCWAKCNSDSDVLNSRKGRAELRVKCSDPPIVQTKWQSNFSSLKCEPVGSECDDKIAELNITKGSLEFQSSGKKGSKYNIVCEDGSNPGVVKCKNGVISTNVGHFEKRACDKFVCRNNGEDVRQVFPIGTGKWECTERNGGTHISCKGKCSKNGSQYTKTQYKVQCTEDSLYGWSFINSISDDGNHPGTFCDSSTTGTYFDRF